MQLLKKVFKRSCGAFEVPSKGAYELQSEISAVHG